MNDCSAVTLSTSTGRPVSDDICAANDICTATRPSAQLVRVKGGPAAAMWAGTNAEATAAMSDVDYLVTLYGRYLRCLREQDEPIPLLCYEDLTAETLEPLLQAAFSYTPTDIALREMLRAFAFDSKVDSETVPFVSDSESKQRRASRAIRHASATHLEPLIELLDRSPDNLGPRLRAPL